MNTDHIQTLASGWLAQRHAHVNVDGTGLTSPAYSVEGWLDAVVPGSVLATLVKNKQAPDPYYGDNSTSIPDISEPGIGPEQYTYWFYNAFDLPALSPDRRVELRFDGINYGATVYFNGHLLDEDATYLNGQPLNANAEGMFRRRVFDITPFVAAGKNRLAVLVTPPNPPGIPGGNGGNPYKCNIGENVVARYPVGWDWVIPMPDRSTGIWDGVSVCVSGPVVIGDPHVVTRVPDVRVPGGPQEPAYLTVTAVVTNTSGAPVSGVLACAVDERTDTTNVTLTVGETQAVTFDRQIDDPRLWWPNGLGRPELYPVTLTFTIGDTDSDQRSFHVGIRQIDVSTMDVFPVNGVKRQTRVFHINGQQVFLRGGNWIGTDAMFRYSTDTKRYRDEVRMHAEGNLNLIRVWGGGIAERDPFYEACDEYGILVMQDFWISGEFNGPFSDTWTNVFKACAVDTIKRLQHHPSLLFWSGGNEQTPPDDIDNALQGWIAGASGSDVLDGTRIYVDLSTNISGSSTAQYEDGPYSILDPADFFRVQSPNPINPEIGFVGFPTYESLCLFMPEDALANFPVPGQDKKQVGKIWQLHYYLPYFNNTQPSLYQAIPDQIGLYGTPDSAERFAYLAQLANYIQYRALFEGFSAHMWEWYAGVLLWKSQGPWAALLGQLYDWYLEQTGGLFGVRRACEPVHVQLDLARNEVMVVNTSAVVFEGTATATIYDIHGRVMTGGASKVLVKQSPAEPQDLFSLQNVPTTLDTVYFVDLRLSNQDEEIISTNFYWLTTGDYQPLLGLAPATIAATGTLALIDEQWEATVTLTSVETQPVAFWIRLRVLTAGDTKRVVPVFYSDNYVSLVPGERRAIAIDFAAVDVSPGEAPEIWIDGWNVAPLQVRLTRL